MFNNMKAITLAILLGSLLMGVAAQPITNTGPLLSLDLDGSGTVDLQYMAAARRTSDDPEDWSVALAVEPWGDVPVSTCHEHKNPVFFGREHRQQPKCSDELLSGSTSTSD